MQRPIKQAQTSLVPHIKVRLNIKFYLMALSVGILVLGVQGYDKLMKSNAQISELSNLIKSNAGLIRSLSGELEDAKKERKMAELDRREAIALSKIIIPDLKNEQIPDYIKPEKPVFKTQQYVKIDIQKYLTRLQGITAIDLADAHLQVRIIKNEMRRHQKDNSDAFRVNNRGDSSHQNMDIFRANQMAQRNEFDRGARLYARKYIGHYFAKSRSKY